MATELEVRTEILNSLKEWGVNPSINSTHATFYKKTLETTISIYTMMNAKDMKHSPFTRPKAKNLPKDVEASIRLVLSSAINDDTLHDGRKRSYYLINDSLKCPFPPYWVRQGDGKIMKKKGFENRKRVELDPFSRFSYESVKKAEKIFLDWFHPGNVQLLAGLAHEAILACYIIHNEACFSCKIRGKLCWNGEEPWRDMCCLACGSTFEIKSKKNLEKIEKEFEYNRINAGSFYYFHLNRRVMAEERCQEKMARKQFLVMVSRQPTLQRTGMKVWPVYISEIRYVIPQLKDKSFNEALKHIPIGTKVIVAKRSVWAMVPAQEYEYQKIAKDTFVEYFSVAEWNHYCSNLKSNLNGNANEDFNVGPDNLEEGANSNCTQTEDLSIIRNQLDSMKVTENDDWENCYSDSD